MKGMVSLRHKEKMRSQLFQCCVPLHTMPAQQLFRILLFHMQLLKGQWVFFTQLETPVAVDTMAVCLKLIYSHPWLHNSTVHRGSFTNSTRLIWRQLLGSPGLGYLWEVMVMDRWGGKHPFQYHLVAMGAGVLFWLVPHLPQRNSGFFGRSISQCFCLFLRY